MCRWWFISIYSSDHHSHIKGNNTGCWLMILKIKVMLFIFIFFPHCPGRCECCFFSFALSRIAIVCILLKLFLLFPSTSIFSLPKIQVRRRECSMHIYDSIHLRWVTGILSLSPFQFSSFSWYILEKIHTTTTTT